MKKNELFDQSKNFAITIENLCQSLSKISGVSNMLFQLRKSSSSIFANISEAQYPQSLPDMLSKFKIALKECMESESWLDILHESAYINDTDFKTFRNSCGRIRRMLISSCNTIQSQISN